MKNEVYNSIKRNLLHSRAKTFKPSHTGPAQCGLNRVYSSNRNVCYNLCSTFRIRTERLTIYPDNNCASKLRQMLYKIYREKQTEITRLTFWLQC